MFIRNSQKASILLYAIFLSAFLLSFLSAFRADLKNAISEATSQILKTERESSISDILVWVRSNAAMELGSHDGFNVSSDVFDGRSYTGTAFSWSPIIMPILSSGAAAEFEIFVDSGAPINFSVVNALETEISSGTLISGTYWMVPYPLDGTGMLSVTSLWGYSTVVIDRRGGYFRYPNLPITVSENFGTLSKNPRTYRTP